MSRHHKKRSRKAGLLPGTLVHIGTPHSTPVRLETIEYGDDHFHQQATTGLIPRNPARPGAAVRWINVDGVHQLDLLEEIGRQYNLHPLTLEDIANTTQRPKLENFGEYLYVVVKMLSYRNGTRDIHSEQVSLIVGADFLISFQEDKEGDVFNPVREWLRGGKGRLRKLGPDYLAYTLLDIIVDNYFSILEQLGEDIENLEDDLVASPSMESLQRLRFIKRELINLRRSIWPLRDVALQMERSGSALIHPDTVLFIRDVYDHTIQVMDTLETYRDMTAGMMDIYLSGVSNRMNAIMKVLTVIATIFMPLTFLAGVYGMNFRHMPELDWPWAYPALWGLMVLVALLMVVYFRKKNWV